MKVNQKVSDTLKDLKESLLSEANERGFWEGRLSSSALATGIAIRAMREATDNAYLPAIERGWKWLVQTQNKDGGWGDTIRNRSNLTATLLVYCSLLGSNDHEEALNDAQKWLTEAAGKLTPDAIIAAVLKKYGDDQTFSAPILTMCAISGLLGEGRQAWRRVPQLPFELAAFPHQLFSLLNLSVVSYALPALIAVGLARHRQAPSTWPHMRLLRNTVADRLLRGLVRMQPKSGGFLEAIPLTGFVTMSLLNSGERKSDVVTHGLSFLANSQRPDGSWPIDSNLSTWLTTHATRALLEDDEDGIDDQHKMKIRTWLLDQQFKTVHPFTHAAPGGWGWTDLPGSVPDADDTAGALLALSTLDNPDLTTIAAAQRGAEWLLNLQNGDGGFPTFCKGWGKLPFDRSCPDITAHAMLSLTTWRSHLRETIQKDINYALVRSLDYLRKTQKKNGSWSPLWFGNEDSPGLDNPTYGTGTVLAALCRLGHIDGYSLTKMIIHATRYLVSTQNPDGGWGSGSKMKSTLEETAIAIYALALSEQGSGRGLQRATNWILENRSIGPAPIGLYFASLWYYEKLYPIIFATKALSAVQAFQRNKHGNT